MFWLRNKNNNFPSHTLIWRPDKHHVFSIRIENNVDPDQMASLDLQCFQKGYSGFSRTQVNIDKN